MGGSLTTPASPGPITVLHRNETVTTFLETEPAPRALRRLGDTFLRNATITERALFALPWRPSILAASALGHVRIFGRRLVLCAEMRVGRDWEIKLHMTTGIRRKAKSSERVASLSPNVKSVQSVSSLDIESHARPLAVNGPDAGTIRQKRQAKRQDAGVVTIDVATRLPSYASRKEVDANCQRGCVEENTTKSGVVRVPLAPMQLIDSRPL